MFPGLDLYYSMKIVGSVLQYACRQIDPAQHVKVPGWVQNYLDRDLAAV